MFQDPAPPTAPFVGVSAGVYLPVDRDVREAFGSALYSFSPGLLRRSRPGEFRVQPNFSVLSGRQDGNVLFALPITASVETQFRQGRRGTVPFLRLEAGAAYIDYALDVNGQRRSGKTLRPVAGIEAGYLINRRLELSASYNAFGSVDGLDFSGVRLRVTYGLFPVRR